ncbi:MAG: serine hydrolase [Bacteroidetes bacterium]|nr:serine hydrolase [Bacteroidota bacterium]MBS1540660.1 serine hydrolase [Bacteroidota bacterium]
MKTLAFLFLIFIYQLSSTAQPLNSKQIDELAARSMKAFNVPGIAVAVIKDGKVIHSKGYGVRSLNTMEKVDENTLFGIASNSKAFTAAALGMLVDEGKIKWDDKVRDYIPEFKLYSPFVTEEFTIRDLLTHRSGLGLGAGDLMFFPDSSDFTIKDVIYNLRFLKATSSFRSKYDYDNNLYIIAGEVVARVSGHSWDEFVEQRIMEPLGMKNTAASFDRLKDKSNVIDGHAPVNGKVQVIARSTIKVGHSAGGINSSIADLSKWVILHLNHGKYGNNFSKKLFSEEVHEEMWTPQTIIPVRNPGPYNTHFASYGLGFGISDVKGYKQVSHTGGLEGMVTQITMLPELNLGIIVLTNQQEGGAFASITNQIKDSYFGISGTDRVSEYSANRNKALGNAKHLTDSIWNEIVVARKNGNTKIDWNAITGTYTDPWLGDVFIANKNGKLWFDSKRSPKLTGELFYFRGNTFVVKWRDRSMDADAFVNFSFDENGKGAGITMKAISPLTDFSYDFHDLNFHREK